MKLITRNLQAWDLGDHAKRVGEMRGRIQLVRRFPAPDNNSNYGLGVYETWRSNENQSFKVRKGRAGDAWSIADEWTNKAESYMQFMERKFKSVKNNLDAATADPGGDQWFLTFTSATQVNLPVITPWRVAVGVDSKWEEGINDRLAAYIERTGRNRRADELQKLGVIIMDFPEAGTYGPVLVSTIVNSNTGRWK